MTEIQKQLLSLLKHALFKAPTDVTETPEIVAEARSQSVSTLVARDNVTLAQNLRVINVHAELTEVLGGIPFTTFKGYASAYYYPQPIYRPMGDVDFIVAQENYWASVESLENAGYTKKASEHERHETFRKTDY